MFFFIAFPLLGLVPAGFSSRYAPGPPRVLENRSKRLERLAFGLCGPESLSILAG
jgi:hypothetical protein